MQCFLEQINDFENQDFLPLPDEQPSRVTSAKKVRTPVASASPSINELNRKLSRLENRVEKIVPSSMESRRDDHLEVRSLKTQLSKMEDKIQVLNSLPTNEAIITHAKWVLNVILQQKLLLRSTIVKFCWVYKSGGVICSHRINHANKCTYHLRAADES